MSGEAAGESGPSGLLPIGLSRTFKEAQRSCDSLVLSARQHPNLKGIVSELDRMEATIKRSAQERFSSFSQLLPTASGLDPFSQAPLGLRRTSSETSLVQTGASSSRSGTTRLELGPIPEFGLMKTLSRTVQSARNAAENARSVAISSFQASVALPMAPMSQAVSERGGIPSPAVSLERMMARPLAVLQQAQQAVESSYSETHVQVYQLMADKLKGTPVPNTRFTTSPVAISLPPSAWNARQAADTEAQEVIARLRKNCLSPPEAEALSIQSSSNNSDALLAPKDEGILADWKKWLVAWELRAAQFSAAELSGEIDYLQGKGSDTRKAMEAAWQQLRSKAGIPWLQEKKGSDLRTSGRKVAIVTTAALPWMTGTAVNPLLRAVFLAKDSDREVTLVVPWLSKGDQQAIFPNITFDKPEEQEAYVKEWARKRTGTDANFKVTFYPGRYAPEKGSILPVGDLTSYIPDDEADVAVLEEPEHLNWYHHGRCWTEKFNHVVGVVHTNYLDYARREESGSVKEKLLKAINSWVCQAHCHKVVKLSGAVQRLPKEHTEFVHGVSPTFLEVGIEKSKSTSGNRPRFTNGFYYIGKVVWAKGYTELLEMLEKHKENTGSNLAVDAFGGGADLPDVEASSSSKGLSIKFHGPKDHLSPEVHEYKAFINPSTSDVVATTSAEALAMGKFLICCEHPSNKFFSQFRNCLIYRTPDEFTEKIRFAMENEPLPLTDKEAYSLTWEAATERFLDIASLSAEERNPGLVGRVKDMAAYMSHNALTAIEPVRVTVGAGAGTRDNPESVEGYQPPAESGGLLDRKAAAVKA